MNALKETKKKHLLAILKYLYLHNSSTMNELVENLHYLNQVFVIW